MNPTLSVILPVYNAEKYLDISIRSILDQTFKDFELIIINDGSTDRSMDVIDSFQDSRILLIENEKNIGLISTLNKGIEISRGKYIARMDADDISHPDRFKKQVAFLEKHDDYGVCGTWAFLINEKGEKIGKVKNPTTDSLIRISLLFTNPLIHPSVMVRSEIFKTFRFNREAVHCEDYELWSRIALNSTFKMKNLPVKLLKYRWHETNVSVVNSKKQLILRNDFTEKYLNSTFGTLGNYDSNIHLRSFFLYKFNEKSTLELKNLDSEKRWFEELSMINRRKKPFNANDFDAFLWSRWIVLCIYSKQIDKIVKTGLRWYNPFVFFSTIRLLRSK